jgi:hypothetical protein
MFAFRGFGQEKVVKAQTADTAKILTGQQQTGNEKTVKSVPATDKNLEAIRLQNRKVTMEQMHTINKAIRKSMRIHKRR